MKKVKRDNTVKLAKFEIQANITINVKESDTFKFNKVLRHYQP